MQAAAILLAGAMMASEHRVGDLYAREIGKGPPIVVLHGGPDFDHAYLLPDLDRLADAHRLVYYDQRGRGRSGGESVTMASEAADLDSVLEAFGLEKTALLGHSWGAVIALDYALRHPERVSRLILLNPAPVSHADFLRLRASRPPGVVARKAAIAATDAYKAAAPDAVVAYYRVHFEDALARPADLDRLLSIMRPTFVPEVVLKARRMEELLVAETWLAEGWDLLPRLAGLRVPALVVTGDHELIPPEIAAHIAAAIPGARLASLRECGHFSYLECPDQVRSEIDALFAGGRRATAEGSMAEALVRQRVDDLARSIRAKDLDGVMSLYAPDIVSFDLDPPLRYAGGERKRRAWQEFFARYHGPVSYEVTELSVTADGELAFVHSLNHVTGMLANGQAANLWVRWTACFRRIDGAWLVVHDHVSVPADLAHGRAALNLTP